MMPLKRIVMTSFGESSWYAGKLVAEKFGKENTILLFADTLEEDEDTYKWGRAAASIVGAELVEIADGRGIWELFRDVRFIGNTRVDPCSRILKRELCDKWVRDHFTPDECVLYYGIGLFEYERMEKIQQRVIPYRAVSPLLWKPQPGPAHIREEVLKAGLWVQRLYQYGFKHANCGGACVKGGHAQWKNLLQHFPDRYARHEEEEAKLRCELGDVAILRDRTGGTTKPLTLQKLRLRVQGGGQVDELDWGGCNCFSGE